MNKFLIRLDYHDQSLSWEERTALFGAYLVESGVQSSTLKSYFSAIKHILKLDGYEWNDKKALLSSLVKGCQIENDRLKIRLPIQKALLELLLFELERYFGDEGQFYLECMYKAMFCLAYYGMLRVGEMTLADHVVKAGDIHVGHSKDKIMVVLYSLKTHGEESRPQHIKISSVPCPVRNRVRFFCPFRIVIQYMIIRGNFIEDDDQFFIFKDGTPVKPYNLRSTLRTLLDRINLEGMLYDVHSFRIGITCDLEKFGYSVDQIKSMGRWKSNAVFKYLRNN